MSREYCDYILDQLSPLGGVSAKRMFGGFGLFRSGLMFGLVLEDTLYFKVGAETEKFYTDAKSEPFRYERAKKTVALSYWNVPAAVLDDTEELVSWARQACQTALTAQAKKPAKRKKAVKPKK